MIQMPETKNKKATNNKPSEISIGRPPALRNISVP
jgi:hypothetical protein